MTALIMGLMLVLAAVAQVLMPGWSWLGQARVPWLLAVVVYYAWYRSLTSALVAGLLAGLLQDVLAPLMPLGYSALCFCGAAVGISLWSRFVDTRDPVAQLLTGAAAGAAVTVALFLLLSHRGLVEYPLSRLALKAAGSAALAGVSVMVVNRLLGGLDRLAGAVVEEDQFEDVF